MVICLQFILMWFGYPGCGFSMIGDMPDGGSTTRPGLGRGDGVPHKRVRAPPPPPPPPQDVSDYTSGMFVESQMFESQKSRSFDEQCGHNTFIYMPNA